jgi:hypothetical protein
MEGICSGPAESVRRFFVEVLHEIFEADALRFSRSIAMSHLLPAWEKDGVLLTTRDDFLEDGTEVFVDELVFGEPLLAGYFCRQRDPSPLSLTSENQKPSAVRERSWKMRRAQQYMTVETSMRS